MKATPSTRMLAPLAFIVLLLSVFTLAAQHAPITPPKRHLSTNSNSNSPNPVPRRPNPFPPQPSPPSLFTKLGERLVQGPRSSKTRRDPKLGPGPGYAASLAAMKKAQRQAARAEKQKRQAGSASATGTSTASAANATSVAASASRNSSAPVWVLEDQYDGSQFFDYFSFYNWSDPTHGLVEYVTQDDAFSNKLAYVNSKGQIIMKADNTTVLQEGQNRRSVRIGSTKTYTGGLFLLDVEHTPYGCGVWPAFWTSNPNWPYNGEIDVYEGVHLSTNNQMTWHTDVGCNLKSPGNFTGFANTTNCDAFINNNEGCAITDQSYSSSGGTLANIGGGVFAMKWDETGISVWFFPRSVITDDILNFVPDPTKWGTPQAHLSPDNCDIAKYFQEHQIIFNITFCGDWAGQTYLTSGCPGTCSSQIMDPRSIDQSYWIINTLRVYTNSDLQAGVLSAATSWKSGAGLLTKMGVGLGVTLLALVL